MYWSVCFGKLAYISIMISTLISSGSFSYTFNDILSLDGAVVLEQSLALLVPAPRGDH